LPDGSTEIFLREGLDRLLVICPSGYFVAGIVAQFRLRGRAKQMRGKVDYGRSPHERSDMRVRAIQLR
jgi:hypothetical protein